MSNTGVIWARTLEELPENIGIGPGIYKGPWDYVVLGGETLPGVARVTVTAGSGIDVQKVKGGKGAVITDQGDPPAKVKIEVMLQGGDYEEFRDFIVPLLRPRDATTGRPPLEIEHPNCELWGISRIMIGDITSNQPQPGGQMTITLDAVEWDDRFKAVKPQTKVKSRDSVTNNSAGQSIFDPTAPSGVDAIPTHDQLLSGLP